MITDKIRQYHQKKITVSEIVPLCYQHGLKPKQISELLGIPLEQVYKNKNPKIRKKKYIPQVKPPELHKPTVPLPPSPAPDQSTPWIEDRTIDTRPLNSRYDQKTKATPQPVPNTHDEALNAYFNGDRTALRRYLEKIGR